MYELTIRTEEKNEILRAMKADQLCSSIEELYAAFKQVWKYSEVESDIADAEKWREKLGEILIENGINLDDIWG